MNISIFKLLIINIIFFMGLSGQCSTYASLSPVFTEIIYALNAQDNLLGVSSTCNYPADSKNKPKIGDTYSVNSELIIKQKPDYIFAMKSSKSLLGNISYTKTKMKYFEFENINDIYLSIKEIAKLTNREQEAKILINNIQTEIEKNKTENKKNILYIIQTDPIITIGNKSYINDLINKSGHYSVTSELNYHYPSVSSEYIIKTKPDIIVTSSFCNTEKLRKLFQYAPIIKVTDEEQDIINRPGPRIYKAVKIFSELSFKNK